MLRRLLGRLHLSKQNSLAEAQPGENTAKGDFPSQSTAIETSSNPSNTRNTPDFASRDSLQPEPTFVTRSIRKGSNLGLKVLYDPPEGLAPAVDIIFVHGLTGNSYDTWCYEDLNNEVHWPSQLLGVDIPDVRILSFGYDADVVGWWSPASNNRIGNHAENLLGGVIRFREKTN